MTLGEFIKDYIGEHDLSLRAFARLTGLSVTYISYLIKGETQRGVAPVPSIDTYKVCAKAMGLETDELVRLVDDDIAWGTQKNTAIQTDDDNLVEWKLILDQLTPENVELLRDQAQLLLKHQKVQDGQ